MALPMRTSGAGVELIKSFEGFRARATELPAGGWIIGYGHTRTAREGLRVTREDAELVLRHHDLKPIEDLINERVLTPLTQNEFDALVSFVFNIGADAFLESNLLVLLNSGERLQAAESMSAWRKGRVDGEVRVVDALVRRRAAEKALFLEHPAGRIAIPGALLRPEFDPSAAMLVSRERPVIIEARTEGGRTATALRAPAAEEAPQAAARAVSERISKLLAEGAAETPAPAGGQMGEVPTAEEITLAVSALAEPDGPGEAYQDDNVIEPVRDVPRQPPMPPAQTAPEPQPPRPQPNSLRQTVMAEMTRQPPKAPAPQERDDNLADGLAMMRWVIYAMLSGLGLLGLFEGVRRVIASEGAYGLDGGNQAQVGILLAFGSAMLCVMAVYYLYRAITRQE